MCKAKASSETLSRLVNKHNSRDRKHKKNVFEEHDVTMKRFDREGESLKYPAR